MRSCCEGWEDGGEGMFVGKRKLYALPPWREAGTANTYSEVEVNLVGLFEAHCCHRLQLLRRSSCRHHWGGRAQQASFCSNHPGQALTTHSHAHTWRQRRKLQQQQVKTVSKLAISRQGCSMVHGQVAALKQAPSAVGFPL
jgi:hypothetical protein